LVLKLQKVRVKISRANIFGNSSIWVSKVAEFDAAIESVEKIAGKFTQKVISVKFFHTIINKNSFNFPLLTLLLFSAFSNELKMGIKLCVFDTQIELS
jgi:hypothetical protein